jgi:hypothetical protein
VQHTFPLDAEYAFRIRVRGAAIGLAAANFQGEELEITIDGERVKLVPGTGQIDVKLSVKAGQRAIGVAFVRKPPPGADASGRPTHRTPACRASRSPARLTPTGLGDSASRPPHLRLSAAIS